MIGFFPDPLPDELLYSACARYHARAGYRSRESTGYDLFGQVQAKVAVDLPCHLDALVATLSPGHRHTADSFIDRNTLLPLYAPFVPPERVSLLREDMRGERGGSIHGRLGVLTSKIGVEFFRYCPVCVEADREGVGEAYWHRLHQAPGVEVCPHHKVFLERSPFHTRNRANREAFVTAERAVREVTPRKVDESDHTHRAYLRIAEDVNWLLGRPALKTDIPSYRDRYLSLLGAAGFSPTYRKVKTGDLVRAVCSYYSPELLESLGCGAGGKKYYWLQRLAQNYRQAQHPLQHLLLMQFLGYPAADFFQLPVPPERRPFGEGPWPCLNRAADHYRQPVITDCEISPSQVRERPRGTFRCRCGFAYSRHGPDESGNSRYVIGRYIAYGKVWEDAFKEMYRAGRQRKEISTHLGVSISHVKVMTVRLGLRPSPRSTRAAKDDATVKNDSRDRHRRAWLEARKLHPEVGRSALAAKFLTHYNWLRRHDREWLAKNSPARRVCKGSPRHVDWRKRDMEFSEAVRKEAERLKNESGRPVRVTATGLAKTVGCLAMSSKRGDLLPLTVKTLAEVSESVEEVAVRRVKWAAKCYRDEGIRPNTTELWVRAGMSGDVAKRPQVMTAINAAIVSIQPSEHTAARLPASS